MKRTIVIAIALFVALSGTAFAGIEATSHDPAIGGFTNLADGGKCSACHIPHGAQGKRLWPVQPNTAPTNYVGDVAVLCGYCHYTTGGSGLTGSASDAFVYGGNSHGVRMSTGTLPYGHADASNLPYVSGATDGVIECTSCHNVHDDTYRPFLRSDLDTICAMCHGDRFFASGVIKSGNAILGSTAFAWGVSASYMGSVNPGSHPVGTDVSADQGADSPITLPGFFNEPTTATVNQWSLGGHRVSGATGGVVCATCHAVHGLDEDPQEAAALGVVDIPPNVNFLTLAQGSVTLGRDVANGDGDASNFLCEACHQGVDPAPTYASDNAVTDTGTPLAHLFANPGATSFGHPVDNMVSVSGTAWVSAFPANWPEGSGAIQDPAVICESCHAPHPYADRARADLSNANSGAGIAGTANTNYILRGVRTTVCNDCHSSGSANNNTAHHPVGITFQNAGVLYLNGTGSAPATETLECSTCHSAGGAHNWPTYSALGIDTAWIPANNARLSQYANSVSQTCIDCHYALDGDGGLTGANDSPTKHDGLMANYSAIETGFAVIGIGTHFLGGTNSATWSAMNPAIAVTNTDWSSLNGKTGSVSRFGGTAASPVFVCESCHELQPSLNDGPDTHLLLARFYDGKNGGADATSNDGRDQLCEGCHLPTGTHPMTGDTVGRTNAVLSVTTAGVDWLKAPSDASYGATWADAHLTLGTSPNLFSCDSCHQVHDANSNGYTYMLDAANAKVVTGSTTTPAVTVHKAGSFPVRHVNGNAVVEDYCGSCHPYK